MEATTIIDTKPFVQTAREFLNKLMAQRRVLIDKNISRINKKAALEAIDIISKYLEAYKYTNETMAHFIVNHFNTIQMIVPGEGSRCHEHVTRGLMKIYNQALVIKTTDASRKFNYYLATNDFGQKYIKTSANSCSIAALSYNGKAEVRQYEKPFQKYNGDVVVEIARDNYLEGLRKVTDQLRKDTGV
jgi:hypothetical protein